MSRGNSRDFLVNILADASQAATELEGFAGSVGKMAVGIGAAWSAVNLGGLIGEQFEVAAGRDFDERMLAAALGAGSDVARDAGEAAGALYADGLGESLAEVNAAVQAVAQNLGSPDEMGAAVFEETAKHAHYLSQVLGEDVTRSTAAASSMIRSGLAKDADEAFDIIARGAEMGVNKSGDLIDTFEEYSIIFTQLGLSSSQSLGLMNQGLQAGARNSDVVADALKEFGIRAQEAMSVAADAGAVEAAQQRVADAHRSAAQAAASAAEQVQRAEESLSRAQEDQRRAQVELTQARRDARKELEDLADQVKDAGLNERGAELAVKRARQNLEDAKNREGDDFDQLAVDEAQLAYEKALRALEEQKGRTKELRAEKRQADREGVDGTDTVRRAQESLRTASDGVAQAQRGVANAQRAAAEAAAAGARQIAEATAALAEVSTPKLTTIGQAYADLGLDGEAIGRRIARGGKAAQGALDEVLDALRAVEDPTKRARLAVELFGTKSEDMQKALYNLDVSTAAEGVGDYGDAVEDLSGSLEGSLVEQQREANREMEDFYKNASDLLGPLDGVAGQMLIWGPALSGVVALLGPMAVGLGGWATAQWLAVPATLSGTAAMSAFAASVWAATWPVLAVVAVIALLAAGAYLIYDNWDSISGWFGDLWDGVKGKFDDFKGWLGENWETVLIGLLTGPFGLAVKWIIDNWDDVKDWFDGFPGWLGSKLEPVGDAIASPFVWGFEQIGDAIGWARRKVDGFLDFWEKAPERVKRAGHALLSGWAWMVNGMIDAWNAIDIKLDVSLPDWMGGGGFKVNDLIPDINARVEIPALASGGITTGPTLALIGDNPGGRELVMPLPPGADPDALFSRAGGSVTVVAPVYLDGREIARTVRDVELEGAF